MPHRKEISLKSRPDLIYEQEYYNLTILERIFLVLI